MKRFPAKEGKILHRPASLGVPELHHVFTGSEIAAVEAALAAGRPLLVRGEPGVGKSQLARAAADSLGRTFVPFVVDVRTESTDLLWHFDAVARLAEAQLWGAIRADGCGSREQLRRYLAVGNFIHPRPLWWAFDWAGALDQATRAGSAPPPQDNNADAANGCVVLIDEIDKAETDVPNGLLEALGNGSFTPQGRTEPVTVRGDPPLVIITTNEERTLPDAFLRRCLVLHMGLPRERGALIDHLVTRATAHFGAWPDVTFDKALATRAAELLCDDRDRAEREHWRPLPGQAEYLDLVRAVVTLAPTDADEQTKLLERVAGFALRKHPEAMA